MEWVSALSGGSATAFIVFLLGLVIAGIILVAGGASSTVPRLAPT